MPLLLNKINPPSPGVKPILNRTWFQLTAAAARLSPKMFKERSQGGCENRPQTAQWLTAGMMKGSPFTRFKFKWRSTIFRGTGQQDKEHTVVAAGTLNQRTVFTWKSLLWSESSHGAETEKPDPHPEGHPQGTEKSLHEWVTEPLRLEKNFKITQVQPLTKHHQVYC